MGMRFEIFNECEDFSPVIIFDIDIEVFFPFVCRY